ncbi:rhomboid family intramembrane serine protease [Mucilaginibacter sp.]|uniref:rhomboid family intramembrane serine protease n=1 Tax=Mucilaginibacter sp. TaxID=1882438 RepID=UPI002638A48B|nr:rhomboid family intramembrane serine protease [Mucilaginibacter sp.]MDB5130050.1 rhomboid family intrarane serine protease [Mucilaginibacter sp.]
MTQLLTKIRLIFIPYIILSLSIIFGYTLLNWLLVIQFEIISLNDEVVDIWIPAGIVILSILFVLYPRIKLLNLKSKKGDRPFLYCFVAAAAITLPTIIAQKYLSVATGKLTALTSIDSINQKPATKYYTLKNAYVAKQNLKTHFRFETTGKNNETFEFYIDVVCPIFSSPIVNSPQANTRFAVDTLSPKAWLGIEYKRSVSNHLSSEAKESRFKDFVNEIDKKIETDNLNDFTYLERAGNNKKRQGFIKAIDKPEPQLILEAQHEPFESRTGDKLLWLFGSFGIGAAIILIMTIIPKLDDKRLSAFGVSDNKNNFSYMNFVGGLFSATNPGLITMWILILNIIIFTAMVLAGFGFVSFDSDDLLKWGANHGPAVANGEWWRLVTCTFLHGGLMHLLGNIYGLFLISLILEEKFTKIQFVSIYLLCGIGGSLSSLLWHPNSIGVGASGAIFGLYGVYLALYLANKAGVRASKGILIASLIFIGLNLLVGLTGNIDNAAHVGGLITGVVLGFVFSFFMPEQKPKRKYVKRSKVTAEVPTNAPPATTSVPLVD